MNNESVTLNKILNGLIYVFWIHQETNKNHREKNYWRNNGKKITISVKNTDFKIQEAQQTSSRINTNKGITFWSSVQFSLSVVSDSLQPHESQHTRPPCPSQTSGVYSNSCPLSQWCHPAISSSVVPFSSCAQSLQASGSFKHQGLFRSINSSCEVAKVLEFQLQHQSFQWTPRTDLLSDGLVGSPCSPRYSQDSSLTPQFKSINFSVLSFLHSPTVTSLHDHWKNHSLDQTELCWQNNVSVFLICYVGWS